MDTLISLDAHAHLNPTKTSDELAHSGAVLAMTFSLDGGVATIGRSDPWIVWGIGCHPRVVSAQQSFDVRQFRSLMEHSAMIGEVGLDSGSHVPLALQIQNFRQILQIASDMSRPISIHSHRATALVLDELRRTPVTVPILHGWAGTTAETQEAVQLGCYFSIHSAVARHSKFRTTVPPERVLVETDHGYSDPPAAIPCRIEWVEHLVAQQFGMEVGDVRRLVWRNLATIVKRTEILTLLPEPFAAILTEVNHGFPSM